MKLTPKKLRNEAELAKVRETLKAELDAAQKINDPAERLEAMLKVRDDAEDNAAKIFVGMINRGSNIEVTGVIGSLFTSIGTGVGLSFIATPAVGFPVMFAMIGGVFYGATKGDLSGKLVDRMQKEMAGHLEVVNEVLVTSSKDIKSLLKTSTNEIAASDKFDSLYDRYPEIRNSFIKAFNKAVALKELPPPQPKNNGGPKLAL